MEGLTGEGASPLPTFQAGLWRNSLVLQMRNRRLREGWDFPGPHSESGAKPGTVVGLKFFPWEFLFLCFIFEIHKLIQNKMKRN